MIRSIRAAAAAAVLALACGPAFAGDWQAASVDDESSLAFGIDMTSITGSSDLRRASVVQAFRDSRELPNGSTIDYMVATIEFDCRGKTHGIVEIRGFSAEGREIAKEGNGRAMPVEPGSTMEAVANIVCNGGRGQGSFPEAVDWARAIRSTLKGETAT